ncbi:cell envelope integrity EipB family protein [Salinarimonas soli]|uniref:Cell envelope integrity EipB family protein n=1 Tax=Salinarimonas soli TaxID=1638099 RepID=A0A5B2W107_9HYPH|nr:cell envelope integrity EipB family protein [Salinarimonas soli]KAA2243949.1 cell envelope integrity EipB family protein [Salinarimonas soli]
MSQRRISGLIAAALLLAASPLAAQERPRDGRMPLVPHRAVYDLALTSSTGSRTVESAQGRIAFDFSGDACDGYALKYRQVTQLQSGEAGERTSDMASATFESADGRELRFRIENRGDGTASTVDGDAERRQNGDLQVNLRQPERDKFVANGPVIFPTAHIQTLIDAAKAGQTSLSVRVFDGSDDGRKVYDTLAVIGRRIEPGASAAVEEAARHESLTRTARWPVTLSYFSPGSGERTPVYVISFELYENGVSRALRLDYGEFALKGDLTAYEPTGTGECRK